MIAATQRDAGGLAQAVLSPVMNEANGSAAAAGDDDKHTMPGAAASKTKIKMMGRKRCIGRTIFPILAGDHSDNGSHALASGGVAAKDGRASIASYQAASAGWVARQPAATPRYSI